MRFRTLTAITAAALVAAPVAADTLFSRPGGASGFSTASISENNSGGTPFSALKYADDFSLTEQSEVTGLRFWGGNSQGTSSPLSFISGFRVRIFADNAGAPGSAVTDQFFASFLITATSDTHPGNPFLHRYELALTTPVTLDAGTTYWMSIVAQKTFNSSTSIWTWQHTAASGATPFVQGQYTQAWSAVSSNPWAFTFELDGTVVPAPTGAAMLLFGVAWSATRRRRA